MFRRFINKVKYFIISLVFNNLRPVKMSKSIEQIIVNDILQYSKVYSGTLKTKINNITAKNRIEVVYPDKKELVFDFIFTGSKIELEFVSTDIVYMDSLVLAMDNIVKGFKLKEQIISDYYVSHSFNK